MNAQSRSTGKKALVLGLILAALLVGGLGSTAAVAQSALPGDALYTIKTTIEDTRLDLARDARARAELQMAFAERRLSETTALVAEGRFTVIDSPVLAFETAINRALIELQAIAQSDPAGAARLAGEITEALARHAEALSRLAAGAPESVRPELSRALDTTKLAGGLGIQAQEIETTGVVEAIQPGEWVIGGQAVKITSATEIKGAIQVGDLVKAHLRVEAGGSLAAREVELAAAQAGDDNGANANTNEVGDDSALANTNEAGDDSANANSAAIANNNEAGDDSANTNSAAIANNNEAGDDSANANTNDASGGAGNTNDGNGGTSNTNDDKGGNGNANDDNGGTGNTNDDKGGNGNGRDG